MILTVRGKKTCILLNSIFLVVAASLVSLLKVRMLIHDIGDWSCECFLINKLFLKDLVLCFKMIKFIDNKVCNVCVKGKKNR